MVVLWMLVALHREREEGRSRFGRKVAQRSCDCGRGFSFNSLPLWVRAFAAPRSGFIRLLLPSNLLDADDDDEDE